MRRVAHILCFAFALSAAPPLAHDSGGGQHYSDKELRKQEQRWQKEQRRRDQAWRKAMRAEEKRYRKLMRDSARDRRYRPYRRTYDPFRFQRYGQDSYHHYWYR